MTKNTSPKMVNFNEATRVQIPALMHLMRLGYQYYGKISVDDANKKYDPDTNILLDIFEQQFKKLNPENKGEWAEVLREIRQELNYDDLGKTFYERLTTISPTKLIDFENIENNTFHFTAEFTCKNGDDAFRPDITLFINGLPLVFVEVKRPYNKGGMVAESERMNNARFPNKKFRRFINITQLMIFSNNMEYDTLGGIVPVEGAFYCTGARDKTKFSTFREDNPNNAVVAPYNAQYHYLPIVPEIEKQILSDFNCQVLKDSEPYKTNLDPNTPTNRILTSMCSPERLLYLLKYSIAYVRMEKEVDGKIEQTDQKHIMRYQQLFASLAVREKIGQGVKSGVIWHTQGSGKTAFSYYLTKVLTDYFANNHQVAKFYFVVDRLDLLEQASQEFAARGLDVKTASTRSELMQQFNTFQSQEGNSGKAEITVVNIQRFEENHEKVDLSNYATNLQRIFIVDEAHRSYNPTGSFLANLIEADPNAIKIALTGTPLLKAERASWKIFGNYLHTYYYDKSIQDGYTLKIIREDIATEYREKLTEIHDKLNTLITKKDLTKNAIIEHDNYVKSLLEYIITDLVKFRTLNGDNTLGGMVICETSKQARKLYKYFNEIQENLNKQLPSRINLIPGLILHDSDDKETRKQVVHNFKRNMTVDILFVFNMLLTGFDAPRLKRLYFARKLKDHNLLQALTRVNRPYKDHKYGYVIDFADIKRNFEETNKAYIKELKRFNDVEETGEGNEIDTLGQILADPEELMQNLREGEQVLFTYNTDNLEIFSQEIADVDKQELLKLKAILEKVKDSFNLIRTFGDEELKAKMKDFPIATLPTMLIELKNRINTLNQKEAFEGKTDFQFAVNKAMENIEFDFRSLGEEELKIIDNGEELERAWKKTIREFEQNIDKEDPEYLELLDVFRLRFKEKGFKISADQFKEEYNENLEALKEIIKRLNTLKRKNEELKRKYSDDEKFMRVHKRIREENQRRKQAHKELIITEYDRDIYNALNTIKQEIDQKVYDRNSILKQDDYFDKTVMREVKVGVTKYNMDIPRAERKFIKEKITKEYIEQYNALYKVY